MIWLKSDNEIELMRESGRLTGLALRAIGEIIRPGLTTREIDAFAEEFIKSHGAVPSFKDYRGYPAAVCTSVNDVVVHGIPDNTKLCEGDIISVDIAFIRTDFTVTPRVPSRLEKYRTRRRGLSTLPSNASLKVLNLQKTVRDSEISAQQCKAMPKATVTEL